jgi:hypothetical protein
MSQESAGARRRVVSGEESGTCGAEGETASALESGGESRRCSDVASGPTPAELLELVDAAIIALDAGESDIARARLQELVEAVRILRHGCREMALTGVRGKKGLDDPAGESDEEFVREGWFFCVTSWTKVALGLA